MAQNAKNHARYVPVWHFITPLIMVALLGGSINNLLRSEKQTIYPSALILGVVLLLFIYYWYARAFALKAQDRAIRAEENFRHYLLTGKPLDSRLRMSQIIALRFASDSELPGLSQRAISENLSSRQIKEAIQSWKEDYNRV